jgi:hypothetical protein
MKREVSIGDVNQGTFPIDAFEFSSVPVSGVSFLILRPGWSLQLKGDSAGVWGHARLINTNVGASAVNALSFVLTGTDLVENSAAAIFVGKEASWTSTATTRNGYLDIHTRLNDVLTARVRINSLGQLSVGRNCSTESGLITIGEGRTDNGYAVLRFVGDITYRTYGLQISRQNTGADTYSYINHRGTGALCMYVEEAGQFRVYTSSVLRLTVGATGPVSIANDSGGLSIGRMDNVYEGAQIAWVGAGAYGDWVQDLYAAQFRFYRPTGAGSFNIFSSDDVVNFTVDGSATIGTGFGCNSKAAQTAYASGSALAAYATGAYGLNSDANMSALHALVVKIRAALIANGIMS